MTDNMKFTSISFHLVNKQCFIVLESTPLSWKIIKKINGGNALSPWSIPKQHYEWYNAYFRETTDDRYKYLKMYHKYRE